MQTVAMNWLPHRFCLNDQWLIYSLIFGNAAITLAYYVIPISFVVLLRHSQEMRLPRRLWWLLGIFIFLCGTTHLNDIVVIWKPWYLWQLVWCLATGIISNVASYALVQEVGRQTGKAMISTRFSVGHALGFGMLTVEVIRLAMGR
jgi:hypothetical protein